MNTTRRNGLRYVRLAWIGLVGLLGVVGCTGDGAGNGGPDGMALEQARNSLVLGEEPDGALGVLELREQLARAKAEDAPSEGSPAEFVVVGRIAKKAATTTGGAAAKAGFILTDAVAVAEHAHEHADGEECPFCSGPAADTQALVQFFGADDKPIDFDARQLFGLEGDELVVVRGPAKLVAGMLMIDGKGVYVRR